MHTDWTYYYLYQYMTMVRASLPVYESVHGVLVAPSIKYTVRMAAKLSID